MNDFAIRPTAVIGERHSRGEYQRGPDVVESTALREYRKMVCPKDHLKVRTNYCPECGADVTVVNIPASLEEHLTNRLAAVEKHLDGLRALRGSVGDVVLDQHIDEVDRDALVKKYNRRVEINEDLVIKWRDWLMWVRRARIAMEEQAHEDGVTVERIDVVSGDEAAVKCGGWLAGGDSDEK